MPDRRPVHAEQERGRAKRYSYLGGCVLPDTSQQHNTHIRDLREICYSWHPWHGRAVWVHATLVKRGRAVAHCSLQELQTSRVLEVPLDVGRRGLLQDSGLQAGIRKRPVLGRTQRGTSVGTATGPSG